MKTEAASPKNEAAKIAEGLMRLRVSQGKGFFKIGIEKKHGEASPLYLEVNGARKFEIGNTCDTCHFWFKCLHEPRLSSQKKVVNLPKTIQMPRPVDAAMIDELSPLFDLLEKGDYAVFETSVNLSGPYASGDENSYFFNGDFLEIWGIEDPKEKGLLSRWEHYEGARPRIFQHPEIGVLEKHFDFIVPLVPSAALKEEYIKLYQSMIANGDRPRVLVLGLYQRPVPKAVKRGEIKNLHSYFAGFILDGHHKLAAYRRAGVAANFLTVLSYKASKFVPLKDEGVGTERARFEERLAALVSPPPAKR